MPKLLITKNLLLTGACSALFACGGGNDTGGGEITPVTEQNFNRISSFLVCSQIEVDCNDDTETAAEIVAVSEDGMTLIYSDSPTNSIGFVDITTPAAPAPIGTTALMGEPTSVAVLGNNALVGVNTSADFIITSGELAVVDIDSQAEIASIDVGGQPDSIAVSPDGMYVAVVIENERDEDLVATDGAPPQFPAGTLVVVDSSDADPNSWTTTTVDLTGLADLFPTDPEPEYVDINSNNVAVITLQENNHIILVDLTTATVLDDYSAGTVSLTAIDTEEEDPATISLTGSVTDLPREPDGVAWINTEYFATADEGDLDGGTRGFTIYNVAGDVVYTSGNTLDHLAVRYGHYPDGRSGNKGNEPENIEVGEFDGTPYLFVNSERSNLVFVYDSTDPTSPVYKQTLPTAAGPEGGLAIPSRDLLVVASEVDDRGDKLRSALNIYSFSERDATYPTLQSADSADGTPIPWSAMSGLAADPSDPAILYSIEDSFYGSNRFFTIDVSESPALLTTATTILDSNDVFAGFTTSGDAEDPDSFDAVDLAAMINDDKSVNIDPEGIAVASDGGFWIASEGAGTMGDTEDRPIEKLNFIFKTDANGVIESVITLPDEVNDIQVRFGFEGIAEDNGSLYVVIQRAWGDEANPRIGVYNIADDSWRFFFYPLDPVESQNGGWVGLSDITSMGLGQFLVIERDNQGGPDAAIKRLYTFSVNGLSDGDTIGKILQLDLMNDLADTGGLIYEKIEGSALTTDGDIYIIHAIVIVDDVYIAISGQCAALYFFIDQAACTRKIVHKVELKYLTDGVPIR